MMVGSDVVERIGLAAEELRETVISLTREFISIPSVSGNEGNMARVLARHMDLLGFDEIRIDEVGNVIGLIRGLESGPGAVLNGHLDTVPEGDMEEAFSPRILSGADYGVNGQVIVGRGACDMKGPLASMVVSGGVLNRSGLRPLHDFVVTASVLEEIGGSIGSRNLINGGLYGKIAVIGEPTGLRICLGHRGSIHVDVTTSGKSSHACSPESGINAIYLMAPVIKAVELLDSRLTCHPALGKASVAACNIMAFPGARNVVPSSCTLSVNFRTTPGLGPEEILDLLERAITPVLGRIGERWTAAVTINSGSTYTGAGYRAAKVMRGLWSEPCGDSFEALRLAVELATGRTVRLGSWRFATDGPCFSIDAGIPTYGFGPGDETVAHSSSEHVPVDDLVVATRAYALLGVLV